MHAGRKSGQRLDVPQLVADLVKSETNTAQALADAILATAVACDQGRPVDDISVVVMTVSPALPNGDGVRRLSVSFPARVRRES
jgi:serine phosphatase RsbU (regulator of sigma subunit)